MTGDESLAGQFFKASASGNLAVLRKLCSPAFTASQNGGPPLGFEALVEMLPRSSEPFPTSTTRIPSARVLRPDSWRSTIAAGHSPMALHSASSPAWWARSKAN